MSEPRLILPDALSRAMVDHCREEAPREACGLLGGAAGHVRSLYRLRNALASPTRYLADERDLIEAVTTMRAKDEAILAIYHSHPSWPAIPSRTDLEQNYYGEVPRIIVSLLDEPPTVRAFVLGPESFREILMEGPMTDS